MIYLNNIEGLEKFGHHLLRNTTYPASFTWNSPLGESTDSIKRHLPTEVVKREVNREGGGGQRKRDRDNDRERQKDKDREIERKRI